jgi:hypothetical protein
MAEDAPETIEIGSASVTSCGVSVATFQKLNRTFDLFTRCDVKTEVILDLQGWDDEQLAMVWGVLNQELPEYGDFLYFYILD